MPPGEPTKGPLPRRQCSHPPDRRTKRSRRRETFPETQSGLLPPKPIPVHPVERCFPTPAAALPRRTSPPSPPSSRGQKDRIPFPERLAPRSHLSGKKLRPLPVPNPPPTGLFRGAPRAAFPPKPPPPCKEKRPPTNPPPLPREGTGLRKTPSSPPWFPRWAWPRKHRRRRAPERCRPVLEKKARSRLEPTPRPRWTSLLAAASPKKAAAGKREPKQGCKPPWPAAATDLPPSTASTKAPRSHRPARRKTAG